MKKTDKTLENTIVKVLTAVCEQSLKEVNGLQWLTHLVNYKDFPRSLTVICIFDSKDQVSALLNSPQHDALVNLIVEDLKHSGIPLPSPKKQIKFDSEEACLIEHKGRWNQRLA